MIRYFDVQINNTHFQIIAETAIRACEYGMARFSDEARSMLMETPQVQLIICRDMVDTNKHGWPR